MVSFAPSIMRVKLICCIPFGSASSACCLLKACVCYVLRIFNFSPNDSPSKTMKDVFYFI